jgi:hypothetical protein
VNPAQIIPGAGEFPMEYSHSYKKLSLSEKKL